MANYTTADIKEIREVTGAGMLDVKKALDEADGDVARATEILRIKGAKAAAKRGERETAEGLVAVEIKTGTKASAGYIIELDSETDFVAKSPDFIALADDVLSAVVKADATDLDAALKAKASKGTVAETIEDIAGTKLRENLKLKNVAKVEGEVIGHYEHKKDAALPPYVGVLVAVEGVTEANANKIAEHLVAALGINGAFPYATIEDVPAEIIESEERVAREKNAGKPDNIMPKIIEGSLKSFYKLNVLSEQSLAYDDSITIKSLVGNGKILDFKGFVVGGAN